MLVETTTFPNARSPTSRNAITNTMSRCVQMNGRGGGLEVELFADKAFLMDSGDFN